jgi:hypothetical protein
VSFVARLKISLLLGKVVMIVEIRFSGIVDIQDVKFKRVYSYKLDKKPFAIFVNSTSGIFPNTDRRTENTDKNGKEFYYVRDFMDSRKTNNLFTAHILAYPYYYSIQDVIIEMHCNWGIFISCGVNCVIVLKKVLRNMMGNYKSNGSSEIITKNIDFKKQERNLLQKKPEKISA